MTCIKHVQNRLALARDERLKKTRKATEFKAYLHYKMITPQNLLFEAQFKNFFVS